jgi:hypothetical protein
MNPQKRSLKLRRCYRCINSEDLHGRPVSGAGGLPPGRPAGQLIPVADAADRVRLSLKMRTVEAVIQPNGEVLLVEPVHLASPRRALVTIMEEAPHPHDAALLSEAALGEDWNRPEEDAAWAHLQPGKSS